MKPIELLILFFIAKPGICDNPPATTQHVQWSYGQIKLIKIEKCRFLFYCWWKYKLQFYESITNNNTILKEFMADAIECNTCKFNPYDEESCTSQSCDLLHFNCMWRNLKYNSYPSLISTTPSQFVYPTTSTITANYISPQSADQTDISTMALGTIISLLSLLVLLLTAGWIWTCWIMKKRGKTLSRSNGTGLSQHSNGYSTLHPCYENNTMDRDTKFESSTNYSLLTPENGTNSGTNGGKVTNGGDEEYCMLDRSCGKTKTTAHQRREQLDGYSRLFSN